MILDIITIVISLAAFLFSVRTSYLRHELEKRLLQINFLLPHLAEISEFLHKKEAEEIPRIRQKDDANLFTKMIIDIQNHFIVKQQIIRALGLNSTLEEVLDPKDKDGFFKAFVKLKEGIDERYLQLIGLK